jgi:nucleotide-binding universal stress UspA family protein
MYERIIVPLDGTAFGEYAVTWATEIARRSNAMLELVHIHIPAHLETELFEVPAFRYTGVVRSDAEYDREVLRREIETLDERAHLLASATGLRVKSRTITGNVDAAIEREANEFGADLIVMSTHARTGIDRARWGSIGDAIVRHSTVPVLLVQPPGGSPVARVAPTFDRILVPLDGSHLGEQIIGPVADLARLFGARVHLVHVMVPPGDQTFSRTIETEDHRSLRVELTAEQYLAHVTKTAAAGIESLSVEVRRAPAPRHGIIDAAAEIEPDMLALATHGRTGIMRILLGSTAGEVLANTELPVLVYRPDPARRNRSPVTEPVAAHLVV